MLVYTPTIEGVERELDILNSMRGSRKGRPLLRKITLLWSLRGETGLDFQAEVETLRDQVRQKGLPMCMGDEGSDLDELLRAMAEAHPRGL